jgi:Na+/H+ antiporter NhaD/arsenite permease-like protein
MEIAVVLIFTIGYLAIVLEHPLNLNKTASALLTGVLCWLVMAVAEPSDSLLLMAASSSAAAGHEGVTAFIEHNVGHHLIEIASLAFFLLGAMTIVELIDVHEGFRVITDLIRTSNIRVLLWLVAGLSFLFSAFLGGNLTTAIVMATIMRKILSDRHQRLVFAGVIIISANAGGAWSPMGDVTTAMLWMGGQVSASGVVLNTFLPSLICFLVPTLILTFQLKGSVNQLSTTPNHSVPDGGRRGRMLMLLLGIGGLVSVPVFKTFTHLPAYMGMLLALGVIWAVSEFINSGLDTAERSRLSVGHALSRVDSSSILFFLGILLAVGALQTLGLLQAAAVALSSIVPDLDIQVIVIGLASAIVDNVPLVAATMGMYDLAAFPQDHKLWEFLAYCAGTGGSVLIIGSAAGVAIMGIEKIEFMWYFKRFSWLALIGYLAGAGVYLVQYQLLH